MDDLTIIISHQGFSYYFLTKAFLMLNIVIQHLISTIKHDFILIKKIYIILYIKY